MVTIDGSQHSGSGTIVRYSVALAALLHEPVRIINVRENRAQRALPRLLASEQGARAGRDSQPRKGSVSRDGLPRASHAAKRHRGVGGDAGANVRRRRSDIKRDFSRPLGTRGLSPNWSMIFWMSPG
jgi:hypothetical protein